MEVECLKKENIKHIVFNSWLNINSKNHGLSLARPKISLLFGVAGLKLNPDLLT
jgi:hypothetical protein